MAKVRTLAVLLEEHPTGPADPVVYAGDDVTTRSELDDLVRSIAERLEQHHLDGAPLGVSMPNSALAIATWFAVWRTGGTVAPLNPRAPASELERLMSVAGVSAVLTTPALVGRFAGDTVFDEPVVAVRNELAEREPLNDAPALIQFTSGTTGRPKAVPLGHGTILSLLDPVIASLRQHAPNGKPMMPNLIPVSLSLWAGIYNVLFAFRVGAPVVLMDRFEPVEFARLTSQFAIRSSVLPPAALVMLLEEESITSLRPLKYVRSVSAPLSPYQARRFHDRFGVAVLNGYGQTELGGEAVGWSAEDWRQFGTTKLGSVGRPHASMRLRVSGPDGNEVPTGDLGEVEIQSIAGPPVDSQGLAGRITADGWLRTGDLGRIDDDGFVWIEGRMSAMINRGGLKVFPDEVEEVLRSHSALADAAVVGVADDRLGEVPIAFVVPKDGEVPDVDQLRAWSKERMSPYKVPVWFSVVAELPRNEMGKVLRDRLVAMGSVR